MCKNTKMYKTQVTDLYVIRWGYVPIPIQVVSRLTKYKQYKEIF